MTGSGIYEIRHIESGKRYIGSAKNFKKRWTVHRSQLLSGTHHSRHLQRSWNKYGEEAFIFSILERCEPDVLLAREQGWFDLAKPEFNVCPQAFSTAGRPTSEETKSKLRQAITGKKRTEETRRRMREAWLTRPPMPPVSEETRKRQSLARKGMPFPKTAEHVAKIAEAHRKLSDEDVKEVKILLHVGVRQSVIAREFGVSGALICNIAAGKTYPEL